MKDFKNPEQIDFSKFIEGKEGEPVQILPDEDDWKSIHDFWEAHDTIW